MKIATAHTPANMEKFELIEELFNLTQSLCPAKIKSVVQFARQTIQLHDEDAVETFLKWKDDPVIDSVLLLASKMDGDHRAELLDAAEMLFDEAHIKV